MANAYIDFLQDPDVESRRAELRDFCGPNAEAFLKTFDQQRTQSLAIGTGGPGRFGGLGVGFTPAAFFLGPVWFFYRKMWAWAWGLTVLLFLLGWFLPNLRGVSIGIAAGMGAVGKRVYVDHAVRVLTRLRSQGALTLDSVRAAGGVSKAAGWISGIVFGGLAAIAVAAQIYLAQHGVPVR